MARRDEREYREYLREEQRRQPGCPARELCREPRGRDTKIAAEDAMVRTRLYGTILAICVLLPLRLDARQLTVEDYYRVVAVQAPAMSPDGRWVAFVRSTIV